MAVLLVQHGKSAAKEVDPERGLTAEGRAEVERVAAALGAAGVTAVRIEHSGKARAEQTAAVFAAAIGRAGKISARRGMDPTDDVSAFAASLDRGDDVMYVGHLPFMGKLASLLLTGDADRSCVAFRNGGVVCLDRGPDGDAWAVQWMLIPDLV